MKISTLLPPLLRAPDFRRLWIGQTISVVGDQVTFVALPLVAVLVLQADAAQMGLLTAFGLLPHLLFSLPAGIWLDRVRRRRRVMIAADIARAVLAASIPVAWWFGALTLEQLFIVGFLLGALAVAFDISWATVFVSVTPREHYVEANSLGSGSRSVASVAGPSLAGGLIELLNAPIAILVDAASYIASAAFLARIRSPEAPVEAESSGIREQIAVGLRFIFRDEIIRPTVLSAATINLFNFGFAALFILFATRTLGVTPGVLGLVLGFGALGAVVGAVIAPGVGRRIGLGPAYALGLILFPAPLILVPLVDGASMPIVLGALFLAEFGAGMGVMILDINIGAVLLARTPDRIRGRAMGSFRFINYGIRPLGALLGGFLGTALGVREALFVVTIAALLGVLWLVGSPVLRLRDLPEAAEI
ncbi:MAG: MFS transporter [Chloroflexota bacterium]